MKSRWWLLAAWVCVIPFPRNAGAQEKTARVVHVYVALADNEHQGIVPVSKALGNGEEAGRNLYWGAAFGVRTYFRNSAEWKELASVQKPTAAVLERVVFYHAAGNVYLIADAYRGQEIKTAVTGFLEAAAGLRTDAATKIKSTKGKEIEIPSGPQMVVYVGHDGLMDFALERAFSGDAGGKRQAIVLACASKLFFGPSLKTTGAEPLLWTTGLMAPEAYALKAALDGWIAGEGAEEIRQRAARAYAKYQKISVTAAGRLFATGW